MGVCEFDPGTSSEEDQQLPFLAIVLRRMKAGIAGFSEENLDSGESSIGWDSFKWLSIDSDIRFNWGSFKHPKPTATPVDKRIM